MSRELARSILAAFSVAAAAIVALDAAAQSGPGADGSRRPAAAAGEHTGLGDR